ncbi:MAG: hypothetical protein ACLTBV_14580 [Enterocloster bolteae]
MGTDHLMVQGVAGLHDSSFRVEGDRIVAGTYGAAAVAAGGEALCVAFARLTLRCLWRNSKRPARRWKPMKKPPDSDMHGKTSPSPSY